MTCETSLTQVDSEFVPCRLVPQLVKISSSACRFRGSPIINARLSANAQRRCSGSAVSYVPTTYSGLGSELGAALQSVSEDTCVCMRWCTAGAFKDGIPLYGRLKEVDLELSNKNIVAIPGQPRFCQCFSSLQTPRRHHLRTVSPPSGICRLDVCILIGWCFLLLAVRFRDSILILASIRFTRIALVIRPTSASSGHSF